jgi:hypothetical protein
MQLDPNRLFLKFPGVGFVGKCIQVCDVPVPIEESKSNNASCFLVGQRGVSTHRGSAIRIINQELVHIWYLQYSTILLVVTTWLSILRNFKISYQFKSFGH